MESSTFLRGQVWYWEDPIYGKKEHGIEVNKGEATMRFSRYCIIAQTTENIERPSILIIPCSSTNSASNDVELKLTHIFYEGTSYAKVRSIMPVNPRYLQRYICTLSDPTMKKIEAEIIKLLAPSICGIFSLEELKERCGLDLSINTHESNALERIIKEFSSRHVVKTDNINDGISIKDMINLFSYFTRNMDLEYDVNFLIKSMSDILSPTYATVEDDKGMVAVTGWEKCRLIGMKDIIPSDISLDDNTPKRITDWTDADISSFLESYKELGVKRTAELFNIEESSVVNYWYRWRNQDEEYIEDSITGEFSEDIPNNLDTNNSISKMTNMMKEVMREENLFDQVKEYLKEENIIQDDFYLRLGNSIYHSLIQFLGIQKDPITGVISIPEIDSTTTYLGTWHFFDKIYHDRRISNIRNLMDLMKEYRVFYGPAYDGISRKWLNILSYKLNHKFNIIDTGIKIICDFIVERFCSKS